MRVSLWTAIMLLAAGMAGCASPSPAPDAPDLAVGNSTDHKHGIPRSVPYCGGFTLSVGNAMEVWAAMHEPPENVTVVERNDTGEWLLVDLPHPRLRVPEAWVHYAFYRTVDANGSLERGLSVTGSDPPFLTLQGTWPDQNETPAELMNLLDMLVGPSTSPAAADALWEAWLEERSRGDQVAHLEYHGPLRIAAAWQQIFGDQPMPPRRAEGDYLPEGRAVLQADRWVWSVTVPYQSWTNGTHTVYADAFGRFTTIVPEHRPEAAAHSLLIEWGLPVPERMFTSLQEGERC